MDVTPEIERSNSAMLDVVWPVLGPAIGGGTLTPAAGVTGLDLDRQSGIDFLLHRGPHRWGVASRVQWVPRSFDTFTIRTRTGRGSTMTEARKRREAIAAGAMVPDWTVQAYLTWTGQLIAAAAVPTAVLIDRLEQGHPYSRHPYQDQANRADGARFAAIPWMHLPVGHPVIVRGAAYQDEAS